LEAKAGLEFDTRLAITYEIDAGGNARVVQEISLTNNFSNIYPQEYRFQIDNAEVKNISASDGEGDILKEVKKDSGSTEIKLRFNQEVAGKGKELQFKVSYSLPQLAQKRGRVWEMVIPGLANIEEVDEFNLKIKVPLAFGSLAYSSVSPKSQEKKAGYRLISFQKSQLIKKPLILAFGDFQVFDFSLQFSLVNPKSEPVIEEIPIPPETAYQSVILSLIEPQPERIRLDQDYNWLAQYLLNPGEVKKIIVKGQAKILSQPENVIFQETALTEDFSPYLKEDQYWQVNHPVIKGLAQKHRSAREIFNFVTEHLEYDFDQIDNPQRVGALKAYQQKRGVCTEFSDLFVTLSRSNGIPARELEGFAFTDDQKLVSLAASNDVLHSWAEYWDGGKKAWVPVDPTWSKTTHGMDFLTRFDLGHFVFVIHGQSSTQPVPPGSYRTESNEKSVRVEFTDQLISPPAIEFGAKLKEGKEKPRLIIKNKSLAPVYKTKVRLLGWNGKDEEDTEIPLLPPLGEREIAVDRPGFFLRLLDKPTFHLEINDSSFEVQYPQAKLNFIAFFVNLLKR